MNTVIEKIQKLRALSKSSNVHEATAAARAADKLINEHRLSEADLETSDHESVAEDSSPLYESGRITAWKNALAVILSRHYGCGLYISKGFRSKSYRVVGRKSDTDVVRYLFAWLTSEISRLCDLEMKGEGHVACGSYCTGAVDGIRLQLTRSREESRKEATAQGKGAALIKLDGRELEVKKFLEGMKLRKVNSPSKAQFDANAYGAGKVKGENMHLGKAMSSSGGSAKALGNGK